MPVLKNARHEKFAQLLAQGKTADEAYEKAGYVKNRKNAARLKTNEDIQARIEDIQGRAAKKVEKGLEDVIREMWKIGHANMANYLNVDDEGNARVDLSEVSKEEWAAVSEVTVDEQIVVGKTDKEGNEIKPTCLHRKTKLKLHDKKSVLVPLGQHYGGFKQNTKVEHSGSVTVAQMLEEINDQDPRIPNDGVVEEDE